MTPPTSAPATMTRRQWEALLTRYEENRSTEYRRSCPRRNAGVDRVELTFDVEGRPVVRTGTVMNVSTDGMLVRTHRIPVGTPLRIRLLLEPAGAPLVGEVRHCTETVGASKVGIQLKFDPPARNRPPVGGSRR